MPERIAPRMARPCSTCGRGFTSQQSTALYCSAKCRRWWANQRPSAKRRGRVNDRNRGTRRMVPCVSCGERYPGHYTSRRLCPSCTPIALGPVPARRCCAWCGRSVGVRVKYCARCREFNFESRRRRQTNITIPDCARCGRAYVRKPWQTEFCSRVCATRAARSRLRQNRRTVERSGEKFTTREIAERDGWRCHLCSKQVPDQPYAARDEDPTLDHLVPVSDGGLHVRTNVRLAHNRCNWERSTGGTVQLLLVG